MRVFLTRPVFDTEWLESELKAHDIILEVNPIDEVCSLELLQEKLKYVDGLISHTEDTIDAALLSQASSNLKIIANVGIGYSNIDTQTARQLGVVVTNTPAEEAFEATAEATVALLLSVARRIPALHQERTAMDCDPLPSFVRPTAVSVRNKTTGVIGCGRIGSRVARIMHSGFNNKILYFDSQSKGDLEQETGACKVPLSQLMSESDFICINMPLSDSSQGLISAEMISKAKTTATIINTARAELIDECALVAAFNAGKLHGIGLDVYGEAVGAIQSENFALTSHFSNFEDLAYRKMTELVSCNLVACLTGQVVPTPVN